MTRTLFLGPTDSHQILCFRQEVCAFFGLYISDTVALILSLLTTSPESSTPVLQTRTHNKRKEVWYWNTGSDDAREVVNGGRNVVGIKGNLEHKNTYRNW